MGKKRLVGIKVTWIIGFCWFMSCVTSLYAGEDKGTEFGINKNQPISVGDYVYQVKTRDEFGASHEYTYIYEGIEKDTINIKIKSCPLPSFDYKKYVYQKTPDKGELIKEKMDECCFSVQHLVLVKYQGETVFLVADGAMLLIRVADSANRILVNEIAIKLDPDIKYDNEYQKLKTRERSEILIIEKPIIYLYPQQEQRVSVKLHYKGEIIASYPQYDETAKGWEVIAYPSGRIVNSSDGKEYSYLFWEGLPTAPVKYDFSKGFVVKGEDTASFLQSTLATAGLTPRESNEFIVYWLPRMQNNKYNLIHFATSEYEEVAKLDITPKPDTILRVFMVFKPLNDKVDIELQEIKPFKREGFTVVEWGGAELK